jgi:hypothetical protein
MEKFLPVGEYIEKGINSLEQNLFFLWRAFGANENQIWELLFWQ